MEAVQIRYEPSKKDIKKQIEKILLEYDHEFFPPLSKRATTTEIDMKNSEKKEKLKNFPYLQELLNQELLLAIIGERIVGFLAFKHNFIYRSLDDYSPSNYVSTIIVENEYRRRGIAEKLYLELMNNIPERLVLRNITVRTWSTNNSHINLLKKIGFRQILFLENHRGKGIHTFYFGIRVK